MDPEPDNFTTKDRPDSLPINNNEQSQVVSSPAPLVKKKKKNHLFLWVFIVVIFIGIIGGLIYEFRNSTSVTTSKPTIASGYSFFNSPKKLGNLNFFNDTSLFGTNCGSSQITNYCPAEYSANQLLYFQIGLTPQKQPIIVVSNSTSYGQFTVTLVSIETTPGHYTILTRLSPLSISTPGTNSGSTSIATLRAAVNKNITIDTTNIITDLSFNRSVYIDGMHLYQIYSATPYNSFVGSFLDGLPNILGLDSMSTNSVKLSAIKKIGSIGKQTFYEVTALNKSNYQVKEIFDVVGGVYGVNYFFNSSLNDLGHYTSQTGTKPQKIKWNDGSINNNLYEYDSGQGCGLPQGYGIIKNLSSNSLIPAGTAPNGQEVYQLPINSSLLKDYYANYIGVNHNNGYGLPANLTNLSINAYQNKHAVIIKKDGLGEYVVYLREDLVIGGGCGKPVIYLYPTKTTKVSVQVGAKITASNPLYSKYGWQNIIANPNGSLIYQGKDYNSLYWEGMGLGIYPLVNKGTIVPHDQVVATIKKQLTEQGFNKTEITDFLNFWQSKLPNTPYTRLTWLTTSQMNELAPLTIYPQPKTLIRAFLDFQGLNKPISLKTQTFTTPQRKGFTVVEWGGLLRK